MTGRYGLLMESNHEESDEYLLSFSLTDPEFETKMKSAEQNQGKRARRTRSALNLFTFVGC